MKCAECEGSGVDPHPVAGCEGDFCPSCLGSGRAGLLERAFSSEPTVEQAIDAMAGPEPGPVRGPVERYLRRWIFALIVALGIAVGFRVLISMLQFSE